MALAARSGGPANAWEHADGQRHRLPPGKCGPSRGRHFARVSPQPDGTIAFERSEEAGLVTELNAALPPAMRRWDGQRKRWAIDAAYAARVADLCEQYLGIRPEPPAVVPVTAATREIRLITVEYLGRGKLRLDGLSTATG